MDIFFSSAYLPGIILPWPPHTFANINSSFYDLSVFTAPNVVEPLGIEPINITYYFLNQYKTLFRISDNLYSEGSERSDRIEVGSRHFSELHCLVLGSPLGSKEAYRTTRASCFHMEVYGAQE